MSSGHREMNIHVLTFLETCLGRPVTFSLTSYFDILTAVIVVIIIVIKNNHSNDNKKIIIFEIIIIDNTIIFAQREPTFQIGTQPKFKGGDWFVVSRGLAGGRRVKQAQCGKLAFLLQNGAFFGPKNDHFRPFRTTF